MRKFENDETNLCKEDSFPPEFYKNPFDMYSGLNKVATFPEFDFKAY